MVTKIYLLSNLKDIFLFWYHLKAHTISNKLISNISAQKKEKKRYDSYKYVFKFRRFEVKSPLNKMANI